MGQIQCTIEVAGDRAGGGKGNGVTMPHFYMAVPMLHEPRAVLCCHIPVSGNHTVPMLWAASLHGNLCLLLLHAYRYISRHTGILMHRNNTH